MEPSIELTAESLWSEVSSRLRGALNETTYRTWFDHVEGLHLGDDEFVLSVPNDFTRDWIEGHFLGLIRAAVGDSTGRERIPCPINPRTKCLECHMPVVKDAVPHSPFSDHYIRVHR